MEGLHYLCSENKGADQLRSYCAADQRLCFRICKKLVFSFFEFEGDYSKKNLIVRQFITFTVPTFGYVSISSPLLPRQSCDIFGSTIAAPSICSAVDFDSVSVNSMRFSLSVNLSGSSPDFLALFFDVLASLAEPVEGPAEAELVDGTADLVDVDGKLLELNGEGVPKLAGGLVGMAGLDGALDPSAFMILQPLPRDLVVLGSVVVLLLSGVTVTFLAAPLPAPFPLPLPLPPPLPRLPLPLPLLAGVGTLSVSACSALVPGT